MMLGSLHINVGFFFSHFLMLESDMKGQKEGLIERWKGMWWRKKKCGEANQWLGANFFYV